MNKVSLILFVLFFATALVTGCSKRKDPSILVLAVDRLPFNPSVCSREPTTRRSGLLNLCDESIRFTHSLTTSPLSLPALTSLMTAQYPLHHQVRANSGQFLKSEFETLAEIANQKGLRTGFFSGGAPVLRKSGLHQGFEHFDDFIQPRSGLLFRPFAETQKLFTSWLIREVSHAKSFFAAIYIPDLNFIDTSTETELGELRSFTYESQLEEFDESLAELISQLKAQNRWDDTYVFLVGLNGRKIVPRGNITEELTLNSDNIQVTTLIKPALKPRDLGMNWKIDRNVNLADIGKTLFGLLDKNLADDEPQLPLYDLGGIFTSPEPTWPASRPLLVESAWAEWNQWGNKRAAIFDDFDLYIHDKRPLFFNTLTDHLEQNPLPLGQNTFVIQSRNFFEKNDWKYFSINNEFHLDILRLPALAWLLPQRNSQWNEALQEISTKRSSTPHTLAWAAVAAIETRDWASLERIARRSGHLDWHALAQRHQGQPSSFIDPCLRLIDAKELQPIDFKECSDELFLAFLYWIRTDLNKGEKDIARRKFLRLWENHQLELRVSKTNIALGYVWFSAHEEPTYPSRTMIALAIPKITTRY